MAGCVNKDFVEMMGKNQKFRQNVVQSFNMKQYRQQKLYKTHLKFFKQNRT